MATQVDQPGTVDDLIADATAAGHAVTVRLVRDWGQNGLLDQPAKRAAGKGHGTRKALYTPNQRRLFQLLLNKRSTITHIPSLARIPVALWLYYGNDHVSTKQARRAFMTWLGDGRATSKAHALTSARALLNDLDHPDATATARHKLVRVLVDGFYNGHLDYEGTKAAVQAVFEPGSSEISRVVGHPDAPITVDAILGLLLTRHSAVVLLRSDAVSDAEFDNARTQHLMLLARYRARRIDLARHAPASHPDLYAEVTEGEAIESACPDFLTVIGFVHEAWDTAMIVSKYAR